MLSRTLLDSVGDAYLLSQHINILVNTYIKQSNYNEARSVASLSLCLLKDVCIIMYDKKSILNKNNSSTTATTTATTNNKNTNKYKNTTSSSSTSINNNSNRSSSTSSMIQVENNLTNIKAYFKIIKLYSVVVLKLVEEMLANGSDPRILYTELVEHILYCSSIVNDYIGDSSYMAAEVYTLYAQCSIEYVLLLHSKGSGVITPIDVYTDYIHTILTTSINYMHNVYTIQKQCIQLLPPSEFIYTTDIILQHTVTTSTGQLCSLPYKSILNPILYQYIQTHIYLSYIYLLKTIFHSEHISPVYNNNKYMSINTNNKETIIDQYLESTKPQYLHTLEDFQVSDLYKASQLLSDAEQKLSVFIPTTCSTSGSSSTTANTTTSGTSSIDILNDISILRSTILLLLQHRDGVYNNMWSTHSLPLLSITDTTDRTATTAINNTATNTNTTNTSTAKNSVQLNATEHTPVVNNNNLLTMEAKNNRDNFSIKLRKEIIQYSILCSSNNTTNSSSISNNILQYACISLIECYGNTTSNTTTTSMWLLQLHSITTSVWLRSIWAEYSLNPTSTIATSLNNLENMLKRKNYPVKSAVKQIRAEQEFLLQTSVPFQR